MADVSIPDLERPAYFAGQRLTADDLAQAQAFSRELRWLHNRSLHGWGIAFGYAVAGVRGARTVMVRPGYALDCAGRDLVLEDERVLEVPAVAGRAGGGPATYHLTVSYAPDDALTPEERDGVCGTRGAVRLVDAPLLRWQDPLASDPEGAVRPGLDVILATATVQGCKLAADLALSHRRDVAPPSPYVASGSTTPGATPWRLWPDATSPLGVVAHVATGAAGFGSAPRYQARLAGERKLPNGRAVLDGYVHLGAASATGFDLRVLLPPSFEQDRFETDTGEELNPVAMLDANLPATVRDRLRWHVVWMGVEA